MKAWLTPNPPETGETVCVRMAIPAGDFYAAAFRGALAPLMDPANWEQNTIDGEYPEVAAEFFHTLWLIEWEPWEENCAVANPVGEIFAWAGDSAPTSALACDGSQVQQSAYPELYAIVGTLWGSADSGYFRLPDFSSRVPLGAGSGSGLTARSVGDQGGEEAHTLTIPELAAHNHVVPINSATSQQVADTAHRYRNTAGGTPADITSEDAGEDTAHENMPPFTAVLWCVWAIP